jgi:hypothetical protein
MPGLTRWSKRRRLSRSAKRRCSSGHRCCVDGRPARMNKGSDPRVRTSAGRRNAPRSSWNAPPFAGRCGNRRPQRWLAPRSRGAAHPVRAKRARGSASRSSARTTNEVRGTGSRRDFARPNDGANLRLDPVRSRGTVSSEARAARLVSPCRPRAQVRGRTKAKAERGSSPPSTERGT